MSDSHLDPHLQAEHHAPDRTMPQGTQDQGVEKGHEGRDLIFAPIFWWFGGLAVFVGLSLIGLSLTMDMWTAGEDREYQLPSPLFAERRAPPEPRILPNPIDSGLNPMENLQEYPEALPREREQEAEAGAKIGVLNAETGEPQIPEAMMNQITARYGSGGGTAPARNGARGGVFNEAERVVQPMPSDSSGGLMDEDRLR